MVDAEPAAGRRRRLDAEAVARFRERMDDDLDTPGALAAIFDLVRRANAAADAGDDAPARAARATVACSVRRARASRCAAGATTTIDAGHRRPGAPARRGPGRAATGRTADALRGELEAAGLGGRGRPGGHPDPPSMNAV